MALRRCTLCGQDKLSGAGKTLFVCDECLALPREVTDAGAFATASAAVFPMGCPVPTIELGAYEISSDVLGQIPRALCEEHVVIPVSRAGGALIVAMADPTDNAVIATLRHATGLQIEPVVASTADIRAAHTRYFTR